MIVQHQNSNADFQGNHTFYWVGQFNIQSGPILVFSFVEPSKNLPFPPPIGPTIFRPIIVERGESIPFHFDRAGESLDDWVCRLIIKEFADDDALISRVIVRERPPILSRVPPQEAWNGTVTSTETNSLPLGLYRLIGLLTNSVTDEQEQIILRFNLTASMGE